MAEQFKAKHDTAKKDAAKPVAKPVASATQLGPTGEHQAWIDEREQEQEAREADQLYAMLSKSNKH